MSTESALGRWQTENMMKNDYQSIYDKLHQIYQNHLRNHKENSDSQQMCCMWSTDDPPDVIEDTQPILDIEDAFDISLDEDSIFKLYDMHLDEAAREIIKIKQTK